MRLLGTWLVIGTFLALSGCAAGVMGPIDTAGEARLLGDSVVLSTPAAETADSVEPVATWQVTVTGSEAAPEGESSDERPLDEASPEVEPPRDGEAQYGDEPTYDESVISDHSGPDYPETVVSGEVESGEPTYVLDRPQENTEDVETIPTPAPIPRSPFKPSGDDEEIEHDPFTRRVIDVPLDIRPTKGDLPLDLAAGRSAGEPTIDETLPGDGTWAGGEPADVYCSYTPWTICYRPLYFEDIKLERYGENVGYLQTGLSGLRFFSSIAALPYKMTVRPPRSCQCSNGFSRCGDCPLPGYGRREFRLDASFVEAAAVAGVVYILP
jgi:hypothetical protein